MPAAMPTSRSYAAGWTVITALLLFTIITQWLLRGRLEPSNNSTLAAASVAIDRTAVARVPEEAILNRLDPAFLDKSIDSPKIVWLIAAGEAIRPYYADISTLVATSIALLRPSDQQFGLYLASATRPDYLTPIAAGPIATRRAQSLMREFQPSGEPRLARAFDDIAAWRPREVFFLVAQPTDPNAVVAMIQRAKADNIVVHVVTIGTPNFGWTRVAWLTGGESVYVRQRDLGTWVDRITSPPLPQFKGQPAPNTAAPANTVNPTPQGDAG